MSLFASCSPALAQAPTELPVVATFSILADLARNVGGERIEVISLVGPNGDAHVYQPSPEDAKNLNGARLILVNGLGLEGWLDRLIKASAATAPIDVATKGIAPRKMEEDGKIGLDPHAWQSIPNAEIYVANIRDGLIAVDPAGADAYRANAAAYLAKLAELDKEVRAALAKIPPQRREIITTHDAFGYFGEAYDFKFIAPEGVSTETEASARDVAKIIRQIKAKKIPAVFLENVADPRMAKRIAEESGATIGGALYSDALSPPDGPASTYVDMMHNNIKQLTAALAK
jgi:zinc/manganese transport system substrate-binding protein